MDCGLNQVAHIVWISAFVYLTPSFVYHKTRSPLLYILPYYITQAHSFNPKDVAYEHTIYCPFCTAEPNTVFAHINV